MFSWQEPCPAGRFGNASGLTSAACSHACATHQHEGGLGPNVHPAHVASHLDPGAGSGSGYDDWGGRLSGDPRSLSHAPGQDSTYGGGGSASLGGAGGPAPWPGNAPWQPMAGGSGGSSGVAAAADAFWCRASVCAEGYFCPRGSVTAKQRECGGPHVYCPWGSASPVAVPPGYYSAGGGEGSGGGHGTTRTHAHRCEAGAYCVRGVRRPCPAGRFGASGGLSSAACDGKCAAGHYCPAGSTSRRQVACPAGRYGAPLAGGSANSSAPAATNHGGDRGLALAPPRADLSGGAPGLKSVACSGRCAAGFWCPAGSTSPFERACGGDEVYCPAGSGSPVAAKPGHYTVGGANATARTAQRPCEPGSFCHGGVKFDCPPGTFGSAAAPVATRTGAACSGLCAKGHWCPAGSTSPTEVACPFGRFGATKGLGTSRCSGACLRAYECRAGSVDQFGSRVLGGAS